MWKRAELIWIINYKLIMISRTERTILYSFINCLTQLGDQVGAYRGRLGAGEIQRGGGAETGIDSFGSSRFSI